MIASTVQYAFGKMVPYLFVRSQDVAIEDVSLLQQNNVSRSSQALQSLYIEFRFSLQRNWTDICYQVYENNLCDQVSYSKNLN
jgi:hypothetical protein